MRALRPVSKFLTRKISNAVLWRVVRPHRYRPLIVVCHLKASQSAASITSNAWFRSLSRAEGPARDRRALSIDVPSGWDSLPADQLTALPGSPLAVIRQTDGT